MTSAWRFIAQRATNGQFLDWDVPLVLEQAPMRELNGPGQLVGRVNPEYVRLQAKPDGLRILEEWSTAVYAEYHGRIRWGGIITHMAWEGQSYKITCAGFNAYPNGMAYTGPEIHSGLKTVVKTKYVDKNHDGYIDGSKPKKKMPKEKYTISKRIDSYDMVRTVWTHLQSKKFGNLGMVVDKHDSGHLLGASSGDDPYEVVWWEAPDCGDLIRQVMGLAGADFAEYHSWDGDKQKINHRLLLGTRRLGRTRNDLRFAQGENIIAMANPEGMGDDYANELLVLGKGTGRKMAKVTVHRASDNRLRRARVISSKGQSNAALLRKTADSWLLKHNQLLTVPQIALRDHPNAGLGSWALGDRILVQVDVPWVGELAVWHRVMAEEIDPVAGTAILTLSRADATS